MLSEGKKNVKDVIPLVVTYIISDWPRERSSYFFGIIRFGKKSEFGQQ
jgi:hypothetical protein